MPDSRAHRGPHPEDAALFAREELPRLCAAAGDLSWLLSRGYAPDSSLKLVGDRHRLVARQRMAVARATCSDEQRSARLAKAQGPEQLRGQRLRIDGYNVLLTVEVALGGGVVLACRDGTYRDLASVHGTYRKVAETRPAIELLGRTLTELEIASAHWLFDRPVSNSGRLRQLFQERAAASGWPWTIELSDSPDRELSTGEPPIATADSALLDRTTAYANLARWTIERHVPEAWVVRLEPTEEAST